MCINKIYKILVGEYAKNHYIKPFKKRHKTWDSTFSTIENMLSHVDMFLLSSKIEKIHICDTGYIAKCEFKIVGTNKSAKASGNRIVIFIDEENLEVCILLLYAKTDVGSHNETSWWENEIKKNYKEIYKLFNY